MELHILQLLDHVRNREDNQAGFMSRIDNALAHARILEERCFNLAEQNEKLREKCRMPMPILNFTMKVEMEPTSFQYKVFYWKMETVGYANRIPCPPLAPFNAENEKFWKLVRRQSYRSFLKLFRKKFDENFETFLVNYNYK